MSSTITVLLARSSSAYMFAGRGKRRLIWIAALALGAAAVYFGAWQLWAMVHYRQAVRLQEQRNFAAAADHLQRVLTVWRDDPAVHLLAAQAARRSGDMEGASPHLRACTRQQAMTDAVALEYRLWHVQNGELSDGAALLARARADAETAEAPLILEALIEGCLTVLAALGKIGLTGTEVAAQPELAWGCEAVDLWLARRPEQPDQVQGLVWRGRLRDMANEHAEAATDLRRAVTLAPDHFEPRWYLAASIGQEAPAEAAEHLAVLAERFPENRRVRLLLAVARHGLGQLEQAEPLLDALLVDNPQDVSALIERGRLALDAQRPAEAESWLRRAEAIAPNHADVLLSLGRTLHAMGRAEDARRYDERFHRSEAAQTQERADRVAKLKELRKQ